jgi:hypothetical protein
LGKPHLRDKGKEQLWRDRIAACRSSGLTVKAFCKREELSEHCFYSWRREIKMRDEEVRAEKRAVLRKGVETTQSETAAFVPVRLVASKEADERSLGEAIEVVAPNGFRVLIPDNASAKSLALILAAVQKTC